MRWLLWTFVHIITIIRQHLLFDLYNFRFSLHSMSFTRYRVFLQFIVTFAVLACVPTLYFLNEHAKIDKRALQTVEQNNIHKLEYAKAELQVSVDQIITAASSLSNNGLLHQAILNPTQENLQNVSYLWLLVAKNPRCLFTIALYRQPRDGKNPH